MYHSEYHTATNLSKSNLNKHVLCIHFPTVKNSSIEDKLRVVLSYVFFEFGLKCRNICVPLNIYY